MEAALKHHPGLTIELVKGDRGVFDVRLDGMLVFSKKTAGRFPSSGEILERIALS